MTQKPFAWTEDLMAATLVDCSSVSPKMLVVPRCHWGGHEKDLLIVDTRSRRLIEIEIKISRSDLKADAKKDKWIPRPWARHSYNPPRKREWPNGVWKHYYALPVEIWKEELLQCIPDASGVILVRKDERYRNGAYVKVLRRAVPDRKAKGIGDGDVLDIARLLNFRYWSLVRSRKGIDRDHQPNQEFPHENPDPSP